MNQAKYWFQKSIELSAGQFMKAQKHLIGLEELTAQAGLGMPKPVGAQQVTPAVAPSAQNRPLEPVSITGTAIPKPLAPTATAEDLDFLEEETLENGGTPSNSQASAAFANLIKDIDNMQDIGDNFTFDDAI